MSFSIKIDKEIAEYFYDGMSQESRAVIEMYTVRLHWDKFQKQVKHTNLENTNVSGKTIKKAEEMLTKLGCR